MRRPMRTKLQILDVRHPGMRQKVHTMFEGFWATREIRRLILTQYGETFGSSTLDRYRRKHWQAQRELVAQMSQALLASAAHLAVETSVHRTIGSSGHLAIGPLGHLAIGPLGHLTIGSSSHLKTMTQ